MPQGSAGGRRISNEQPSIIVTVFVLNELSIRTLTYAVSSATAKDGRVNYRLMERLPDIYGSYGLQSIVEGSFGLHSKQSFRQ